MEPKDQADALLRLIDGQLGHFAQTRSIEFKVNMGLWTLIVVSGGFLFNEGYYLDTWSRVISYIAIAVVLSVGHLLLWMVPIQGSEDTDNHFILEYRRRVESLLEWSPKRPTGRRLGGHGRWWITFEVGVTVVLLTVTGLVLTGP